MMMGPVLVGNVDERSRPSTTASSTLCPFCLGTLVRYGAVRSMDAMFETENVFEDRAYMPTLQRLRSVHERIIA